MPQPADVAAITAAVLAQLNSGAAAAPSVLLPGLAAPGFGAAPAPAFGMQPAGGAPAGGVAGANAVLVPVRLQAPDGSSITLHLSFGPEYANPAIWPQLIGHLQQMGVPVNIYKPKSEGFGGGGGYRRNGYGGGGGYGGGFGGNGGGGWRS